MKPTLFVLAAGMGSRYGGLKQLDGIGPHGETIMDYSIYDAIRCGFGKIVFVIRKDFEEQFREKILSKYENHIPVEVVFQSIDKIPAGIPVNPERAKPWGTNHAVLMGKDVIKEPFAVINADDFYGYDTFRSLAEGLKTIEGKTNQYLMVGFRVANTLSESGGVSRGVCATNADGYLETVTERHDIMRREGGKVSFVADDKQVEIDDNTPVSMNVWGFTPDYFAHSERSFEHFLREHGQELKAEFYIPTVVNELIQAGTATCRVLDTTSTWFGVTYAADRPMVVEQFRRLADEGVYPEKMF